MSVEVQTKHISGQNNYEAFRSVNDSICKSCLLTSDDCHDVMFMYLRKKRPKHVLQYMCPIAVPGLHLDLNCLLFGIRCLFSQHLWSVRCIET